MKCQYYKTPYNEYIRTYKNTSIVKWDLYSHVKRGWFKMPTSTVPFSNWIKINKSDLFLELL